MPAGWVELGWTGDDSAIDMPSNKPAADGTAGPISRMAAHRGALALA